MSASPKRFRYSHTHRENEKSPILLLQPADDGHGSAAHLSAMRTATSHITELDGQSGREPVRISRRLCHKATRYQSPRSCPSESTDKSRPGPTRRGREYSENIDSPSPTFFQLGMEAISKESLRGSDLYADENLSWLCCMLTAWKLKAEGRCSCM